MARPIFNHREADVTTTRTGRRLLIAAAAAGAVFVAAPGAGAAILTPTCTPPGTERVCDVYATATSVTLPGVATPVPTWRFTDDLGQALQPLVVNQNEQVRVRLHNNLTPAVSLAFPQVQNVAHGAGNVRGSDKTGATTGNVQEYVFTASRPGTFIYEAGPTPTGKQQVAMGLAGALVVLPTTPGQAYPGATTAYDTEDTLVLSEIDPALNNLADPTTFNLRNYHPEFVLVNGQPVAHPVPVTQNQRVLVRYVNAGLENHWAGLLGLQQAKIGANAEPLANLLTSTDQEQSGVVAALPAGGTAETLVQVPNDAAKAGFRYPLFDEGRNLAEVANPLLAYLEISGTLALPACPANANGVLPPTVNGLDTPPTGHIANLASPNAATNVFTVAGRALECRGTAGAEQPADGIRYAIDTLPTGAALPMLDANGAFSISLSEADVAGIASGGQHYLIVQAQKGTTWGAIAAVQLVVDNAAPELSIDATPAIINSTQDIVIAGSATDHYLGESDVTSVSWSLDGGAATTVPIAAPAVTTAVDLTIPGGAFAEGPHTVAVTATDALGNTSVATNVAVTVDNTPPAVSGVVVEQRLPADALHPFGGVLTTQNNGTLTFDPNMWAVRVRGTAVDGISSIKAMRGSFDDAFCGTTAAGAPQISGARIDPHDGAWSSTTEDGYVYVPLTELNRWLPAAGAPAVHKAFNVRARDGAGNWSACAKGYVDLDRTSPVITDPLQLDITAPGEAAITARSARARTTLVVRLSARDAQGLSAAEFFDGNDPGRGKGLALRPRDGVLNSATEALVASTSIKRWAPGVHRIQARVRDNAGNWSVPVSGTIRIAFPRIFADGFESRRLRTWSKRTGGKRVSVGRQGRVRGHYALRIVTSRKAAFLTDNRPKRATSYRASFSLTTGTASTGGAWQTVFAAIDQRGKTALAVQRRTSAAGQVVRIVTLVHGRAVGSSQTLLSGKRHVVSVAWFGAKDGEATLRIDGLAVATMTKLGNAGESIEAARLGQVAGGNARTRGNLFVDDFESTS
jgi:hypothetical protein